MYLRKQWLLSLALSLATIGFTPRVYAASGAEIFKFQCAACHGDTGAGDGNIASTLLSPPPTFKGSVTRIKIERVLAPGISTTPGHSAAKLLTPEELEGLMSYVESLSK